MSVLSKLVLALVLVALAWPLSRYVDEWVRLRWGFFCGACGHRHFGSGYQFGCGGEGADGNECQCQEIFSTTSRRRKS